MNNFFNKELCTKCGGRCCKQSGCLVSIRDCKEGLSRVEVFLTDEAMTLYCISSRLFAKIIIQDVVDICGRNMKALHTTMPKVLSQLERLLSYPEVYLLKMRSEGMNAVEKISTSEDFTKKLLNSGRCVKLTSIGCEYSDEERPFGGVALIPRISADGNHYICQMKYSMMDNAIEWLEFHDELGRIFNLEAKK